MEATGVKLNKENAGKNIKKRQRNVMTLTKKVELLDKLKEGISIAAVGRMYHVNESTVRTIKRSENKIREAVTASRSVNAKQVQIARNKKIIDMEKELHPWIQDKLQEGEILTKNMIREQAISIYESQKKSQSREGPENTFLASKGWFDNFKKRYSLQHLKLASDFTSAECDSGQNFSSETQEIEVAQIKQEVQEDDCVIQQDWGIDSLNELFLSATNLANFIVSKDPCIERSTQVVQNINEALTPYLKLLEKLQSTNLKENSRKKKRVRSK